MEENEFITSDKTQSRAIYAIATGQYPNDIYKNTIKGGNKGYAMANSLNNRGLEWKCNTVEDKMDNLVLFPNTAIKENQGLCAISVLEPARNVFAANYDATDPHIWIAKSATDFKYHFNQKDSLEKPKQINNQSKVLRFGCDASNNCHSRIPAEGGGFNGMVDANDDLTDRIDATYKLLDHNKTQGLIDKINDPEYPEDELIEDLQDVGPYLSEKVLIALMNRNQPIDSIEPGNILQANHPHSNRVWPHIENHEPSLHPDSLAKLRQYQDSISPRKHIIDSLHYFKHKKGVNYNNMLYYASTDTSKDVDDVIEHLSGERDHQLRLLLADLYMEQEEYDKAENVFDSIPQHDKETKLLVELRTIQLDLLKDGKTWMDIGSEGYDYEDDLESIAFGDSTVASYQAMAMLELLKDTSYALPFQDKTDTTFKMAPRQEDQAEEEKPVAEEEPSWHYTLHPTLYKNRMIGKIELPEEESGTLRIYSIQGVQAGTFEIEEGTNRIPLNESLHHTGIFIYKVFVDGELKNTDKLVKVH